ncbi:MAG: transcription-repair coupling factor [Desulfovibrionales bacterium]|nr:transcription-repair coupling factor [Desulfovibrionales bacterium]
MLFSELVRSLQNNKGAAVHVARSGPASQARLARTLRDRGETVVVVARDAKEFAELNGLLRLFTPSCSKGAASLATPHWEDDWITIPQHPAGTYGKSRWAARMASLYGLGLKRRAQGVLLSIDNFLPALPPEDIFAHNELLLTINDETGPDLIVEQAVEWGYTRVSLVTQPGEIALRGDILDIFCPGFNLPVRLEFFGDILEEIRLFEPTSQRSRGNIQKLVLLPASPVVLTDSNIAQAAVWWKQLEKEGTLGKGHASALQHVAENGEYTFLPGCFYKSASFLESWLPKDAIYILPSEGGLNEALEESERSWITFLDEQAEEHGVRQPVSCVLRSASAAEEVWQKQRRAYFEELKMGVALQGATLSERSYGVFQDIFQRPEDVERPWHSLVQRLREWMQEKRQVVLSFATERSRTKFLKLAEQDGLVPHLCYGARERGLFALVSSFRRGIALEWDNILLLGEDVLQPKQERQNRAKSGAFSGLKDYDDLKVGAHLVHRDYGIATFGGLHRLDLGDVANDFLLLQYAGEDKLYLPVDRLSLIQLYKGPDGAAPALDKLGGAAWKASKSKAKKAIEKIAHDIMEMYAWRRLAKGFGYGPVNELYREFEASFGFEETPDQARAIQDVLDDMQKPEPMDRLVCGDVGFGKTEVAMRAAFRAACEGKQVALLCPTTVLAEQHYQTFKSRLSRFPVHIGLLSRFVTRAKQKEVLSAAARGQVDILIGTHRLLSDDVDLPNLSLLVLDEEQRFGVRHKEKLKKLKRNVDVLTLTATPIPRTLQLSMSGVRELSVIETAPVGRKPVQTALIEREQLELKGILERELSREGQVFWVYNRVEGLERVAEYVRELVPTARIGMAHGRMSEKNLEETMHKFWHGELDVLVCTSIVESGLDFPRANTLIVDQAQMFGLGQLYQLRGRVGRSDRQAHAVFVVNNLDKLPAPARKRLRIILELDYLGAGFRVAMEDLRLRGAGNILGEAQSGQMARVGLDMYLEMLEAEVKRLKGEKEHVVVETEINLGINAHIPEAYIPDGKERLKYYKALSSATDAVHMQDVELEIRDRFGPLPEELMSFLGVLEFKRFLMSIQVERADILRDKVRLTWAEDADVISPVRLVQWVNDNTSRAKLTPPATLELRMKKHDDLRIRLANVKSELEPLVTL